MTTDATTYDQLEITIALVASDENPEWLVVKTTVHINGESPLRSPRNVVDADQLFRAARGPGKWFPWTCSCGYPGCAGYEDGVETVHDGPALVWADRDAHRTYRFDAALALQQIERAAAELRDRLASLGDEAAWVGAEGELAEDLADWYASTVIVGRDHIGPYRRRARGDEEHTPTRTRR